MIGVSQNTYFDLKGYINLQVIGAEEKEIKLIQKQLGVTGGANASKDVDITLRFVEHLAPEKINFVGFNKFGYTDKEFYLLNPLTGSVETQIPLNQIGDKCEIFCQRGINRIPLLIEILKISFLQKNILSLHASAFEYDRKGIVMMGWAHGGKTSALLAYMQKGAKFVADDWVLYDLEKDHVFGFSGKLSLSENHLQQMPVLQSNLGYSNKIYLMGLNILINLFQQVINVFKIRMLHKLVHKLRDNLRVDLRPQDIFQSEKIAEHCSPRKFMLMTSHNQNSVEVQPITSAELIDAYHQANDNDYSQLHETYLAYRFAFPSRRNMNIEKRHITETRLLKMALVDKQTLRIFHPYPLPFKLFLKTVLEN